MHRRSSFSSDSQARFRGGFAVAIHLPPHTKTFAVLVHGPGHLFRLQMHGCMSNLRERRGSPAIAPPALLAQTSLRAGMTLLVSNSK
jgi:hypothetical protein